MRENTESLQNRDLVKLDGTSWTKWTIRSKRTNIRQWKR